MTQLRLDDLLARDVDVQWFEGVAVVQSICRALRTHGGSDSSFPSAADVVIAPGGSIAITGAAAGNAVAAAGHLLARMFSDDAPVRLRLAVSQATATKDGDARLAEFSEQLAYFERPNPEGIVESLRQRAMAAPPRLAPAPRPGPAIPQEDRRPTSSATNPVRRVSKVAVVAAAVAAAACASVWATQLRFWGSVANAVVAEPAEAPAPGHASTAPRASRPTRADVPSRAVVAGATARQTTATSDLAPLRGETTADAEVQFQLAASDSVQPIGAVDGGPARLSELTTPERGGNDRSASDDPDRIYSQNDRNVTLPQNVYPKFPTYSAAATGIPAMVLELTIAKDGLVEQVKMLTPPRNIHEFMIVSVAKAWRFEPARIDGRAIRYRHTISMNATARSRTVEK